MVISESNNAIHCGVVGVRRDVVHYRLLRQRAAICHKKVVVGRHTHGNQRLKLHVCSNGVGRADIEFCGSGSVGAHEGLHRAGGEGNPTNVAARPVCNVDHIQVLLLRVQSQIGDGFKRGVGTNTVLACIASSARKGGHNQILRHHADGAVSRIGHVHILVHRAVATEEPRRRVKSRICPRAINPIRDPRGASRNHRGNRW